MRDQLFEYVYTKPVADTALSENLTVSTSVYTSGAYLHTGVIQFNVFPEKYDSAILLKGIKIREIITAGTLAKKALRLLLFDACDFVNTVNNAFAWTDATATTLNNIVAADISVASADYVELTTNDAIAEIWFSAPKLIKNNSDKVLYGIAIALDTLGYDATALVNIELIYEQL